MSVATIRAGLVTRLATITGLRVPSQLPDSPNPPMAMVRPERITFNQSMSRASGTQDYEFAVMVIVGRASERTAQALLDEYADPHSTKSVKTAIEADRTLSGAALDCRVTEMRGYQAIPIGENTYLGAEFLVTVIA